MLKANVYKPRYKVAFQAKSKIWPYKSSRLRRFFNVRGRKLVRRGDFKRHVVVFNNMKWTVARRYIRPATLRRNAIRRRYRDAFYNKQKLRLFHGKIKEQAFRKFFRRFLISSVNRNRSFYAALERRVDVFFFRMRLLPTIFACHQYIHHYGILVNRKRQYSPNALLSLGDTVSIQRRHWKPFFRYMFDRLYFRVYGKTISLKRQFTLIRKKTWWIRRKLRMSRWIFRMKKRRFFLSLYLVQRQKMFLIFFNAFTKRLKKLQEWQCLTQFEDKAFKVDKVLVETCIRLKSLYLDCTAMFNAQWKSNRLIKKRYRKFLWLSWFWWRRPFKIRNFYLQITKILGSIYTTYLKLESLSVQLKLEELNFYAVIIPLFEQAENAGRVRVLLRMLRKKEKQYIFSHRVWKKKLLKHYSFFLRKTMRKHTFRSFFRYVPRLKRTIAKGSALTYYLVNHRYKKARKRRNFRLKVVHWALPKYMQMDFRTMRAVLLYPPVPKEIHYSFKCSLIKIASFYKSLAL